MRKSIFYVLTLLMLALSIGTHAQDGGGGGIDNVAIDATNIAARNAIAFGKRKWGLLVRVYADPTPANNITYYLQYNQTSTNKSDNGNWVDATTVFGGGGGGGSMIIKSNNFDASSGNFPLSGTGVSQGWSYIVGTFGTLDGVDVVPGAILIATANNPGNTWAGGWNVHQ